MHPRRATFRPSPQVVCILSGRHQQPSSPTTLPCAPARCASRAFSSVTHALTRSFASDETAASGSAQVSVPSVASVAHAELSTRWVTSGEGFARVSDDRTGTAAWSRKRGKAGIRLLALGNGVVVAQAKAGPLAIGPLAGALEGAVAPFPKAALHALRHAGARLTIPGAHDTPFLPPRA